MAKTKLLGKNGRSILDGVPIDLTKFDDKESMVRSLELINESMQLAKRREVGQKKVDVALVAPSDTKTEE